MDQYLRVNKLEIVGLPEAELEETNEEILISALNTLEGLNKLLLLISIYHIPFPPKDVTIKGLLLSNLSAGSLNLIFYPRRKRTEI